MVPRRPSDPGPSPLASAEEPTFLGVLRPAPQSLLSYRRTLGLRSDRSALLALARAIGSSPGWGGPVTFVARVAPEPVLGIFGAGERLDRARFALQVRAAESGMGRLRYVGYREAERAAEQLAHRLVERFGEGPLRSFRWAALPRGGLLVLGMLAARLGLPPQRLGASPPGEGQGEPLVVVDDCALSGARFAAFLAGLSAPRVVFAHLYSPAALREAVVTREPRVLACLAARDLDADGAADVAEEWSEARRRWAQRLDGDRYGPGAFERIAFPWNEPDRLLWNPEAAGVELGWKLVPPELCLHPAHGHLSFTVG